MPRRPESWLNEGPFLLAGSGQRTCPAREPSQEGPQHREAHGWPWCRWPARPRAITCVYPPGRLQAHTPSACGDHRMISGRDGPWSHVPRSCSTTDAMPFASSIIPCIRSKPRSPGSNGILCFHDTAIPKTWEAQTSRRFWRTSPCSRRSPPPPTTRPSALCCASPAMGSDSCSAGPSRPSVPEYPHACRRC